MQNRQYRLAARPVGLPKPADWQFTTESVADPADGQDVPDDGYPQFRQQPFRQGARHHPGRRLPGARPLEHVPHVVVPVFHDPREIGVARPGTRDRGAIRAGQRAAAEALAGA